MEHDAWPPGGKDLFHPGLIADIGDARHEFDVRKLLQKLSMNVKQAVLSLLYEKQIGGTKPAKLPA
jgi:hypothetical protein